MVKRMLCVAILVLLCGVAGAAGKIDWMTKVYSDGAHNAFTDLVRWKDHYYVCFRHGQSHLSMDGEIRLMRSTDLKTWEPCGTIDTLGDDRDPHFAAADDRLCVYFGTWDLVHGSGNGVPGRGRIRSHFASSTDGATWSKVQGVYEPLWWLWRVHFEEGEFHSIAYSVEWPSRDKQEARLLRSADGLNWEMVSVVTQERKPDEADWLIQGDKSMVAVMRTCDKQADAMLLRSDPVRKVWTKKDLGVLVHSPVMVAWKNRVFIAGRGQEDTKKYCARVWELAGDALSEVVTLPSAGDTGYVGMLADPATADSAAPALLVSWYSQHERAPERGDEDSVYVARIVVE